MRYLWMILTVLVCSSSGKTDTEALVKNIDAQVKAYDSAFMSYKAEWKPEAIKRYERFLGSYDTTSKEERDRHEQYMNEYRNGLETTKEIKGLIFSSADGKCKMEWQNQRDCIWTNVYALDGKTVKMGLSVYDTYIRMYFKKDKLILYIDDESDGGSCQKGVYYFRAYFNGNKMIAKTREGPLSKKRREMYNGERSFYNMFTSQDSILTVAGNTFKMGNGYGFRMK
jgi:hypothetical protein